MCSNQYPGKGTEKQDKTEQKLTTLQKKLPTKIPEIKPVVRKNSEEDSSFTARNATGSVKDKESQFFSLSQLLYHPCRKQSV